MRVIFKERGRQRAYGEVKGTTTKRDRLRDRGRRESGLLPLTTELNIGLGWGLVSFSFFPDFRERWFLYYFRGGGTLWCGIRVS